MKQNEYPDYALLDAINRLYWMERNLAFEYHSWKQEETFIGWMKIHSAAEHLRKALHESYLNR